MKVKVLVPPTVKVLPKALSTVGTAAVTVIQAPVVPPPELAIAAVRLVVALIWVLPLVLAAFGQAVVLGVALLVTLTVSVQLVAGLVIWLLVMVMTLVPAVAVREPAPSVQVPPKPFGVAMIKPDGRVSVKLKVCVGLPAGWLTVKVIV